MSPRESGGSGPIAPRSRRRGHAGFSLIELMIAMTIGLALVAALVTLVINDSRAHAELDRSSRQIENGRFAIDQLTADLKVAGYYGGVTQDAVVSTAPDACETDTAALGWNTALRNVPAAVVGIDPSDAPPPCAAEPAPGTGMIALHRVSTAAEAVATVAAGNLYLQSSQCDSDPSSTRFVASDDAAAFTLRDQDCARINPVRRYLSRLYFVSGCSDCGRDRIPTLKRLELRNGALVETPIAEGIQEIQFEYGFDVDEDGRPDEFRTGIDGTPGSAFNDWANVMAVRIHLLSRTTEPTPGYKDRKVYELGLHGSRGPFNDAFKRRAYSEVVRLNNPAGRRE